MRWYQNDRFLKAKLVAMFMAAIIGTAVLVTVIWGDPFREQARPVVPQCSCPCARAIP